MGGSCSESMEKLTRVHKLAIETRIKEKLSVRHPLFAWLVEFCADLYNRFQVGPDGKTAQQRLKGKHSNQVMVEFGTAVMFRVFGKVQGSSMGERWFHGIFLGKKAGTEENFVIRENGSVVRALAIGEFHKVLTLKDCGVLRGTPPIRSGLRELSRGKQVDHPMYPEMILKNTLMNYNNQDVRESDEKSSRNSV